MSALCSAFAKMFLFFIIGRYLEYYFLILFLFLPKEAWEVCMSSFNFGSGSPGTYYNVNKDSEYAAASMENAIKYSGARREQVLKDLKTFVPEAAAAYFVELSEDSVVNSD